MSDFGVSMEEANQINEAYSLDPRTHDRRICICGHSISRHTAIAALNTHACKPGRLECPCQAMRPVIEVPNTRYFMRKSLGSGAKHALVRGVAAAIEASSPEEFEERRTWLVPPICDKCKVESKYFPVRINKLGYAVNDSDLDDGYYAFLCELCRNS